MKEKLEQKLGIYVHIPFCRSKCAYCDFYSLAGQEHRMDDYQKALVAHIREVAPLAKSYQVDTIYFGGGTPSYYGAKRIKYLLKLIKQQFSVDKNAEITMEANPDSLTLGAIRSLRREGVNRISMGMQTACPEELSSIGRPHSVQQTQDGVQAVHKGKIKNVSLDLMYGLPNQTEDSWKTTLEEAISLNPQHLSCYGLKVEDGTPLAVRVESGELLPDDDIQAEQYLYMVERLQQAGYLQYEISNFAKEGYLSRHNMRYWMMESYVGFGPGAHSDFGGCRYSVISDLDGYIDAINSGGQIIDSNDIIPAKERGSEYIMLRLRTLIGIEEMEYRRGYLMDFAPLEKRLFELEGMGLSEKTEDGHWRFTPRGMLLSNVLIGDLLERQTTENLETRLSWIKENG